MSIVYPSPTSTGGGAATRTQYTFNPTINTTFPITVTGSTDPLQIATIHFAPQFLYQTSGDYYLSVVGYITSSASGSNITGTLSIPFGWTAELKIRNNNSNVRTEKFVQDGEPVLWNFAPENMGDYGFQIPVYFSGSTSDYTASVYGIYFSPVT